MKLQNKKTGEIIEFDYVGGINTGWCDELTEFQQYKSIKEFNSDWEDYEEPKEHWYIDCDGEVYEPTRLNQFDLNRMENIGNHFETKEEAEKAVEKLKAWKRLRDKGFEFESWFGGSKDISFWLDTEIDEDIAKDLDLLFGGEE